ncbi:MAG: AAA family ATPase [Alphaproteobacteria bacterium]
MGRDVIVWPDNDAAGTEFFEGVREQLRDIASSLRTVPIPAGKPAKWDAYDATPAEREALINGVVIEAAKIKIESPALAPTPVIEPALRLAVPVIDDAHDPESWAIERYEPGKAPPREWLLRGAIPLATAGLFVAMGDTGKGMLLLDMALKVAAGRPDGAGQEYEHSALGCMIEARGTVVIVSAEDDEGEIHRRLEGIDPDGDRRRRARGRLFVLPMPNMGGAQPFFVSVKGEVRETKHFDSFRTWVMSKPGIKMIVIDPLSSFSHVDPNAAEVGGFVTGRLAALAAATGAAVIVAHHMRKAGQGKDSKIDTVEAARNAVRGSGALIDGVRWAYAFWPIDEVGLKIVQAQVETSAAFFGAIVKSNGPADRTKRTFYRSATNGLLIEIAHRGTDCAEIKRTMDKPLEDILWADIAWASHCGLPYTNSGTRNGIFENRASLSLELQAISRDKLRSMATKLHADDRLVRKVLGSQSGMLCLAGDNFDRGGGSATIGDSRTRREPAWWPS